MGKGNPIKAVGNVFKSVGQATGMNQKPMKMPKPPKIASPTGPKQYSRAELSTIKGSLPTGGLTAPSYMNFDQNMTDLQKRTAIATKAVGGSGGIDKEGLGYYRSLAYNMLGGKEGPLDIEKQFVTQGLGEQLLSDDIEGYLSAIERVYGRMKR